MRMRIIDVPRALLPALLAVVGCSGSQEAGESTVASSDRAAVAPGDAVVVQATPVEGMPPVSENAELSRAISTPPQPSPGR